MNSQLQSVLNLEGYRTTRSRELVFGVLNGTSAISVKELRQRLRHQIPESSLYRALDTFREIGIISDVVIGGKRMIELTGEFRPHHHHVSCQGCGTSIDINDEQLERYLEQLAKKNGYAHFSHSFEITGLCQTCQVATK